MSAGGYAVPQIQPIGQSANTPLSYLQNVYFNNDTGAGFSNWLNGLGHMSFNNNQSLRRMYDQLVNDWHQQSATAGPGQVQDWSTYLRGQNANQLVESVPKIYRTQFERFYAQPARWVSYGS